MDIDFRKKNDFLAKKEFYEEYLKNVGISSPLLPEILTNYNLGVTGIGEQRFIGEIFHGSDSLGTSDAGYGNYTLNELDRNLNQWQFGTSMVKNVISMKEVVRMIYPKDVIVIDNLIGYKFRLEIQ